MVTHEILLFRQRYHYIDRDIVDCKVFRVMTTILFFSSGSEDENDLEWGNDSNITRLGGSLQVLITYTGTMPDRYNY